MSFRTGDTTGGYEFIDLLESSRSGVTYKVRNVVAQRMEVLRVLPRSAHDDQERVERFLREIKVHARLTHPNIVAFYHAGLIDGQLVMTTEFVEGVTLAQRLELGAMPWQEAVTVMSQVLRALGCAHEQSVIHRDVTPANILLVPDGMVKLAGFGLAKGAADPRLTQAGVVQGSLHYISPEQIKGIGELDARSDIYSAGAILYEAAAGRRPFEAQSQFEIMAAHVNTAPAAAGTVNPAVPAELDAIILKALAKDPAARFQTAAEFLAALEAITEPAVALEHAAPPLPATPEAAVTTPLFAAMQRPGFSPGQLMLAGAFMFLLAAIAFAVLMSSPS